MPIPYYLQDLPITPDPNDKSGRVEQRGTLDEDAVLAEMLKRGTGLSKQDILAVVDLYTDVVSDLVQEGFTVNSRLANFRPSLKGVFRSATDPFDPSRHQFRASISEGLMLKKKMREATGERQTASIPAPVIIEYFDHATSIANGPLTLGNIGEITGEDLKFNQSRNGDGIFLIRETDASETRVQSLSVRTDGKLMFLVPASLAADDYFLEVRRSYRSPTDIRIGRLNEILTVSAS